MKTMNIKNSAPRNFITVLSLSCFIGLGLSHAQTTATPVQGGAVAQDVNSMSDTEVLLQAIESVPPAPAASAPRAGTFFSAQHAPGTRFAWPPLPANARQVPVWNLGDGVYLLSDLNVDYSLPPMSLSLAGGRMGMNFPSFDGGGGGSTNGYEYSFTRPVYTTNDLWLEMTGKTNTTAYLTIHEPWNVTNGVWGLYFKTNLAIPYNWTRLLTNAPGQTNLTVTNLQSALGFFMLGNPTAIRSGFTNNSLGPNDDDHYLENDDHGQLITNLLATIGFPINFFGTTYTNLYVNNNGNVTFDNYLPTWTPKTLVSLVTNNFAAHSAPTNIIAPFWADVDTRGSASGVTTYGTNTVDGRAAFGATWINVGYYFEKDDKLNSFQLVLIDRSDRANGDFDLEFNYSQIQWEIGDASGGSDGLGGSSARAGYASAGGSAFELNGSGTNSAFLDSNTVTGLIYTNFNSTVPGRYVFQFHNGAPLATP
jgi:hypothetical protein